jgi:hypothetical protein
MARTGLSIREISKRANIPPTSVHRLLNSPRPRQLKDHFFLRGIEFFVGQVFQVCRHLVREDTDDERVQAGEHVEAEPTTTSEPVVVQQVTKPPVVARPETQVVRPGTSVVSTTAVLSADPRDTERPLGRGKAVQAARAAEAAWAALAGIPEDDEPVAVLGALKALAAERVFLTIRGVHPTKQRPSQRVPVALATKRLLRGFEALDAEMKGADEAWLTAIERQAARTKRITAVLDRREFGEALRGQTDEDVLRIVGRRSGEARQLWLGLSAAALARASKLAGRAVRLRDCDEAMKHRRALASVLKADRDEVRRAGLDQALTTQCLALLWPDAPAPAPPPARMADVRDFARPPVVPFDAMVAHLRAMSPTASPN